MLACALAYRYRNLPVAMMLMAYFIVYSLCGAVFVDDCLTMMTAIFFAFCGLRAI